MANKYLEMISQLEALVRQVADEVIFQRFNSREFVEKVKLDGSVLTEVDKNVQDQIEAKLSTLWPGIAFLGEEMPAEKQQQLMQSTAVWCLDPIDGTSNFASGIPFFGVSLALIENQQSMLGLIYDPMRRECFSAVKGEGCWLNGVKLDEIKKDAATVALKEMIAVVDLKRLRKPESKKLLSAICDKHPYRSQRNFGSCAIEWCWLAAGRFQVYIHGGQKLWDYAAGILILTEAGGKASTINGDPVKPGLLEPQPVVAGSNEDCYKTWRQWVTENK
jgi:myo-inositol-1(or 4)-monophosphatase